MLAPGLAGSSSSSPPPSAEPEVTPMMALLDASLTDGKDAVLDTLGPGDPRLPLDMRFNEGHVVAIAGFSVLMLVSSVGNITVLCSILRKGPRNQINLMLSHLAVADLLVTFLMMPLEIGWAYTVTWEGGDLLCRLMSFFRAFGLYLSGFVVMCISLDRYCAVLHPLAVAAARRRGRIMLASAWLASFVCSLPQAVVFSAMQHPHFQWFTQCLTYNIFTSHAAEVTYAASGVILMYVLPLVTIIYCYSAIILEICRRVTDDTGSEVKLRRSNSGNLCRAKVRTLKMTVTIVAVFLLCWTPYNVMLVWYFIDRHGGLNLDFKVQRLLLLFACTNSSVNPLVYGFFNIRRPSTVPAAPPTHPSTTTRSMALNSRAAALQGVQQQQQQRSTSARLLALRQEEAAASARRPTF